MKGFLKLLVLFLFPVMLFSQDIEWEDVSSNYEFPEGLKLFHGTKASHANFLAYYFEVDLQYPNIAIRPYLSSSSMQVDDFSAQVGAYGAINAGFFSGSSSVSSVIYPNEVLARNLISVVRTVGGNTQTYPLIRPVFNLHYDRSMAVEWVYHHSYDKDDIYLYDAPLAYACDDPNPLPVPQKADGTLYEDIAYGIGGGPTLIKNGEIQIAYCEEIWWGSGVLLTDNRPRTAVGYTSDNKAILFVTNHMKIGEVAELLLELGCYEAMNLDGGGSTAMAVGSESIYDQNRPVPTILAVVHTDSLDVPAVPVYEHFIDTQDEGVTSQGEWFPTANEGFWQSPSMLHPLASHEEYFDFPLNLPGAGEFEIYGWWTSHANRASDTPFFITHADGVTEVAMDQSIGGSMWNLIGTFQFNGTPDEKVRITAGATTNNFVVADGIRVVSYDPQFAINFISQIWPVDDIVVPFGTPKEDALAMLSPVTTILDAEENTYEVDLQWEADNYQANVPGNYEATGSFELPGGVEQTTPPTPLEVTAVITVEDEETSISSFREANFRVFPNPNQGVFTIEGRLAESHELQVLSLDGKSIYQTTVKGFFNKELNLSGLSRGIYLLTLSGNEHHIIQKIVIQ